MTVSVGIDVGGTKTHLALAAHGTVEHRVVATSVWQHHGGLFGEGNVDRLLDLARVGVPDPAVTPLVIGAHGCDSPAQTARLDALVRDRWPGPVEVRNDAELLGPAFGVDEAICLIVGTGSIVIGRTVDDRPVYVGGHGWLLDDYGSAPGITREAVRAVLRATDTGTPRDGLAESLFAHFGVDDEVDLSQRFAGTAAIDVWAEPARLVFECAEAGSATATAVIEDAADRLASDVARARTRGARGTTVVAAGGVVSHQPRLLDAIARHLARYDAELTLELLTVAPVLGALSIAHDLHHAPDPSTAPLTDTIGGTR